MNFEFNDTFYGHDINVFPVLPQIPRHRKALAWLSKNWSILIPPAWGIAWEIFT